jgi:hypothetical protein
MARKAAKKRRGGTSKRGPGRPPNPDGPVGIVVAIRSTLDELSRWERAAKAVGLPLRTWIRMVANESAAR